jgi:hypothetical protein
LNRGKKILSLLFKLGIGFGCTYIIYGRIKNEFGWEQVTLIKNALAFTPSLTYVLISLLLIPMNWGIESRKWQLITKRIEPVNYTTALKSVYSGICLGNFAPGRATEFLGKILFFSDENKGKISVLHFVNGMIQLGITLIAGLLALILKLEAFSKEYTWLIYLLFCFGGFLVILFIVVIYRVNYFLHLISKFLSKKVNVELSSITFPTSLWLQLFSLSIIRYLTFCTQFYLLLTALAPQSEIGFLLPGIALYFIITSLLPMVSFLEAAIRAAIAMVVLADSGLSSTSLAVATVLLWLFNIVVPSTIGYLVLLRMKFDFKLIYKKK